MKCPKCDKEMTGQPSACLDCGLLVDTQEFDDAVNVLLEDAVEEDERRRASTALVQQIVAQW